MNPDTHTTQAFLSIEPVLSLFDGDARNEKMGYIAKCIGSTNRSIIRWQTQGVSLQTAERIAELLGHHPSYIWGSDYHMVVYYENMRIENTQRIKLERKKIYAREKRASDAAKKVQSAN